MNKNKVSKYVKEKQGSYNTSEELLFTFIKTKTNLNPILKTKIVQGYANEVYKVDTKEKETLVVKINRNGKDDFINESWAMNKAKEAGVSVADVLFMGQINIGNLSYSVLIQTFLKGTPLIDYLQHTDKKKLARAYTDLGKILSALHSVKLPEFGKKISQSNLEFKSWDNMVSEKIESIKEQKETLFQSSFTKNEVNSIVRNLSEYKNLKAESVLCHGDLGPDHILVDDDFNVTGLIDLGLAQGNSFVLDFFYIFINDGMEFVNWIKEGYENKELFADNFELKLNLHSLMMETRNIIKFNKINHLEKKEAGIENVKKILSNLSLSDK